MLTVLPLHQGLMALVWLGVVVLLILAVSQLFKLMPQRFRQTGYRSGAGMPPLTARELSIRGSVALDVRRRLYLVEADGQSALILTGGTADVMLALKQGSS